MKRNIYHLNLKALKSKIFLKNEEFIFKIFVLILSEDSNEIEFLNDEEEILSELNFTKPPPELPSHFENCNFLNKREKQIKFKHKLEYLKETEKQSQLEVLKILGPKYDCPLHAEL